jgi:hypothetical protein
LIRKRSTPRMIGAFMCLLALTLVALLGGLWIAAVFCGGLLIGLGIEITQLRPGQLTWLLFGFALLLSVDVATMVMYGINRSTVSIAAGSVLTLIVWELWRAQTHNKRNVR